MNLPTTALLVALGAHVGLVGAHEPVRSYAHPDGLPNVGESVRTFATTGLDCDEPVRHTILSQSLEPGAKLDAEGFLVSGRATEIWQLSACGRRASYEVAFEYAGAVTRPTTIRRLAD